MNWKKIWNPFATYSERQMLLLGLVGLILLIISGYVLNTYIGILKIAPGFTLTWIFQAFQNILISGYLAVLLYLAGLVVNTKTRFIDLLAVALVQRSVLFFITLLGGIPYFKNVLATVNTSKPEDLAKTMTPGDLLALTIFGMVTLVFAVYSIVLAVNGFKTATHARKPAHYILFVIILLIADPLFSVIIRPFFQKF